MNKLLLAVSWGVFALAISNSLEKSLSGYLLINWMAWVIAPVIEEFAKWIGYKKVQSFSIFIPIAFFVGEISIKMFEWNNSTSQYVGQEAWATTLIATAGSLFLLKHISFWSLPYLLGFRWYAFPLAVLSHSIWNLVIYFPELYSLMALILVPTAFVLAKWGKQLES